MCCRIVFVFVMLHDNVLLCLLLLWLLVSWWGCVLCLGHDWNTKLEYHHCFCGQNRNFQAWPFSTTSGNGIHQIPQSKQPKCI